MSNMKKVSFIVASLFGLAFILYGTYDINTASFNIILAWYNKSADNNISSKPTNHLSSSTPASHLSSPTPANNRSSSTSTNHLSYFIPRAHNCSAHQHVAFLKVHKAGSTTVMNLLQRFGEKRSLVSVIRKGGTNYLGYGVTIQENGLLRPPPGKSYDLLYCHAVYNRAVYRRVMPNDTVYIAIVRDPLNLLESAIRYLQDSFPYIRSIPEDKLTNFLANPRKFEPPNVANSFTNNRMSFDFGLTGSSLHNPVAIEQYLKSVDQDFQLVLILEYFDESLVLLRKILCWTFEDILYIPANKNMNRHKTPFTKINHENFKKWEIADIALYDHFYQKFVRTVKDQGNEFYDEVKEFKRVIKMVGEFCDSKNLSSSLVIHKSAFNHQFTVEAEVCKFMKMAETKFLTIVYERHLAVLNGGKSIDNKN